MTGPDENEEIVDVLVSDFDLIEIETAVNEKENDNLYVKSLLDSSDLHVLNEKRVKKAFTDGGEVGLFHLFFTKQYLSVISKWTSGRMMNQNNTSVSESKFRAYVGLEMAMSIIQMNDITEYWKKGMFVGHHDFVDTMSRDDFKTIRGCIIFRPDETTTHQMRSQDPLWHCRKLLDVFHKQCVQIAVPVGSSALDENTARTKARTRARSYIPNKPDPYGIRFYALVGWSPVYLFTMNDNRSGNYTSENAPEAYCKIFSGMRTPYNKFLQYSKDVDGTSPTASWILQIAHQSHRFKTKKRVTFMDNFYTRHVMARVLKEMTDGECLVIGTVKFTNVDGSNRHQLKKAIQELADLPRGQWKLVRAYNKVENLKTLQQAHAREQSKKPKAQRVPFVYPEDSVAEKAGYIVWKDSKVVVFYTNDLASTPPSAILDGTDEDAIFCVNGLAELERWTGTESMSRTKFMVPSIIVAYNIFMNSVDRMDQLRSTNPTRRREKRVEMTIFTLLLDLAVNNAFALYNKMWPDLSSSVTIREFKRNICEQLVLPHRDQRNKRKREVHAPFVSPVVPSPSLTIGCIECPHALVKNRIGSKSRRTELNCHLCMILHNKKKKTLYGCTGCHKGFHVECFTAYHFRYALDGNVLALVDMAVKTEQNNPASRMFKPCKQIGSICSIDLSGI